MALTSQDLRARIIEPADEKTREEAFATTAELLKPAVKVLRSARDSEQPRLKRIDSALRDSVRGHLAGVYVPRRANREYRMLVEQSRFNVLDLVVTSVAQNLFADGFRPTGKNGRAPSSENADIWEQVWQPNRMDARQAAIYRSAIAHGVSYVLVLPGDPVAKITPMSACRMTALYRDPVNDEWPELAMELEYERIGYDEASRRRKMLTARIFDDEAAYTVEFEGTGELEPKLLKVEEHDLTVCPVVRFRDRYDLDVPCGKVEPLIPLQQQINQVTFSLAMALQFAAFRQRWVTGMEERIDPKTNQPIPPLFNVAVDQFLQGTSPDMKFGEFSQTDVSGYLESRDKILLHAASVAQIPPQNLVVGSGISNVPAEALELLAAGHRQDIAEHQTSFGESIEQMIRLAGKAMGDKAAWEDMSAQVVWRDTTPRSPGQVVDALGKGVQMLAIPPKAMWERFPGVTDQDLKRWREMADEEDGLREQAEQEAAERAAEEQARQQAAAELDEVTRRVAPLAGAAAEGANGNGRRRPARAAASA